MIRFRWLDKYNFVIERQCEGKSGRWVIEGYFTRLDSMLKSALRRGITGSGASELLQALKESEARVLTALQKAIDAGTLCMHVSEANGAVRRTSTPEKRLTGR